MNAFFEYEDIYGRVDIGYLSKASREIFEFAAEIREKLGKQGYLLDSYICKILEGMSKISSLAAMERAQDLDFEFYGLLLSVMRGTDTCAEHPFYESAKEYIASHPLEYQEETTRHNLYSIALLDGFLEIEAENYREVLKDELRGIIDIIDIRHLQRDIGRLAGDLLVERLNMLMRQRFLLVTPMAAFTHGLTDSLLSCLTRRDDETSKMAVQLAMDSAAG